jgi:glycine betaine/proline transport system substrate-binding protein
MLVRCPDRPDREGILVVNTRRKFAAVGVVAAAALMLSACAGSSSGDSPSAAPSTSGGGSTAATVACGSTPVQIADNDWVGYEADVAVVDYVLRTKLNCQTKISKLAEQVSWEGFGSGQIDVILENWGHPDLAKKYITDQKKAVDLGSAGNNGVIGWFVPKWMADKYPDITDWNNLNKYADLFKTAESGGKGQLLDGSPSYVTNDEALVKNLNLNYAVKYTGSEAGLITALKNATEKNTPLLMYFYTPQWALAKYPVAQVKLPTYTPGCDADLKKVACDYPPYPLNKVARADWVTAGGPAVNFIKNFSWTNDDQNSVAAAIQGGATDDAAAKAWVDANQAKVDAWLAG